MRLRTSIYVSALIRREFSSGGFAAIMRKGAEEAGAVFLVLRRRSGHSDLYGPAPQLALTEGMEGERLFERLGTDLDGAKLEDALQRQIRFDPDCWIVEIESDAPLPPVMVMES